MQMIETDFGLVIIGPKFQALYDMHDAGLAAGKRSKKYKTAFASVLAIDQAITIMALAEFLADGELVETP